KIAGMEKEIRRPQHSGCHTELSRKPAASGFAGGGARCGNLPYDGAACREARRQSDCWILRVSGRQPDGHAAQLGDLSLASRVRANAGLAVEREGRALLEGGREVCP